MKRPLAIYFVAFWCLFALFAQAGFLKDWLKVRLSDVQIPEEVWRLMTTVMGVLVIWHIVRLIQLKAFSRWFSILFLAYWTMVMIWKLSVILAKHQGSVRPVVGIVSLCALNCASIYYLGRRSFRQFSVEFVAEREKQRHSQIMQKISQKRIWDNKCR